MFIRAHAMRYGPNFSGPWIVDNDMLRRYKILGKNQGIEVDRVKVCWNNVLCRICCFFPFVFVCTLLPQFDFFVRKALNCLLKF